MCYSARIKTTLKELSREFRAQLDLDEFEQLFRMRLQHPEQKIPFGLDRYFLLSKDPAEARMAHLISEFYAGEKERHKKVVTEAEAELREWEAKKPSKTKENKIGVLERRIAKQKEKMNLSVERIDPLDDRIFPFYFAPVVVEEKGQRKLVPARYRVQNPDGSEVPGQYNVFNARRDSLLEARTWRPLLGKNHLIFPFQRFYEWVEKDGKKQEIYFSPESREMMWAAGLFVRPKGSQKGEAGSVFRSFAMITDDPPKEVAAAGHDRCPIFLQNEQIEKWLNPQNMTPEQLILLLRSIEKTFYLHGLAV